MKVIVIGAGAAGLMAACRCAQSGAQTLLIEKNEKAGKKIYITGKGRCNVTNACDFDEFLKNVCSGSRFMMSSLKAFGPEDMMQFLEKNGCRIKKERGNRVFPVSDHASDVTKALLKAAADAGVRFRYHTEVLKVERRERGFTVTVRQNGKTENCRADSLILCTGGLSYPSTGSTGDGYRIATELGHGIKSCVPSLVSLKTEEDTAPLAGISLKNIVLKIKSADTGKTVYSELGELLFTHSGISGPLALSASAVICEELAGGKKFCALIDLKPALDEKTLDSRLLKEFKTAGNTDLVNALAPLLINGIRQFVLKTAGIAQELKVRDLTRQQRKKIREMIRELPFHITGTGGFEEAVITRGGVKLSEIDPRTMESKIIPGLYFAGEVLDIDAYTGGFNLQLAWTTGNAAGCHAADGVRTDRQGGTV